MCNDVRLLEHYTNMCWQLMVCLIFIIFCVTVMTNKTSRFWEGFSLLCSSKIFTFLMTNSAAWKTKVNLQDSFSFSFLFFFFFFFFYFKFKSALHVKCECVFACHDQSCMNSFTKIQTKFDCFFLGADEWQKKNESVVFSCVQLFFV
jgi:hypothetical protein